MTKVNKGEFEKIKDVKVEDVSLTCDASLEVFNNEVSRLSKMDDDLFTYEVEMLNATTMAPGMYKLNPIILAPQVKNNKESHKYYLKHTMEQATTLREVVEQAKSRNPLDNASYSACVYVKLIQELLSYIRDTCPDIHKPREKLVAVTPINKKKIV
ncbi:hypothetical protein Tco_0603869 [Tanacetum coccineum]